MKLHRNLGVLGLALSAAIVVFGSAIPLVSARQGRFFPFPDAYSLLAVSFAQMLLFALFTSLGLLLRRNAETHKRLMLMAPQLFLFHAFGRLLHGINALTLSVALCFYLAGPIYDLFSRRRIHSVYRCGVPFLILTMPPFTVMASDAALWREFIARLLS